MEPNYLPLRYNYCHFTIELWTEIMTYRLIDHLFPYGHIRIYGYALPLPVANITEVIMKRNISNFYVKLALENFMYLMPHLARYQSILKF